MRKKNEQKMAVKKQDNAKELIWEAAIDGDWDAVKEWLKHDPSLITVTGFVSGGLEAALLHVALMHRLDKDSIKYLIELGADVNTEYDFGGLPLNMTSNVEILECLVSHGANPDVTDWSGRTPLHYAAIDDGGVDVLKFFVGQAIDTSVVDRFGKIALDYADTEEKKRLLRRMMTGG